MRTFTATTDCSIIDRSTHRSTTDRSIHALVRQDRSLGHFEETLERVTDAFFALDTEWRFTYVNDRAEKVLARDREKFLGNVIWEVFPEAVGTTFQHESGASVRSGSEVGFR